MNQLLIVSSNEALGDMLMLITMVNKRTKEKTEKPLIKMNYQIAW